MIGSRFFLPLVAVALVGATSLAHAQLLEDVDVRREGNDAVATIRFVTPVQLQRTVSSRSSDLVQVFYTILPTSDRLTPITGERRVVGGGELPQLIVTDESAGIAGSSSRKLLVRFSKPVSLRVRPGADKHSIQVVMQGLGAAVPDRTVPAPAPTPGPAGAYAINLQRSTRPGQPLAAPVPRDFQDKVVFTSRQVADGQTVYETNLGYFRTMPEAQHAHEILSRLFPQASIFTMPAPQPQPQPQPPEMDLDTQAAQRLAEAQALAERGDAAGTIEALNAVLAMPPNGSSRLAQELIGDARIKAGDTARARAEYELFLKLYPAGADADRVKVKLAALPQLEAQRAQLRPFVAPSSTTSGSLSLYYFGGKSQVRTQEFQDSPIGGLPTLISDNTLSNTDLNQVLTNVDLNWRLRDADKDMRLVVRDSYIADMVPDRSNSDRLSALYFERRGLQDGTSLRVGRQSPSGGGILFRFDGVEAGYAFAPKWKVNAVVGAPSDALLDTRQRVYGLSVDAEALTPQLSSNLYLVEQTIDGETDRRAVGTEWRYFKSAVWMSGQVDYDVALAGLNIVSVQGNWQLNQATAYNFMYDRRATPIRSLANTLFFQDPLSEPARRIADLLQTTTMSQLRERALKITPFQTQALAGFTTRITDNWQTGADLRYTAVDAIEPVPDILPEGQPATGDLWGGSVQLIGSNLYSVRDTHVFNATYLTGPAFDGQLLAYNNLTSLNGTWQLEPSIRYYLQKDNTDTRIQRWMPGLRVTYRVRPQVSIESEASYEMSKLRGPARTEDTTRTFYYVGARYDF